LTSFQALPPAQKDETHPRPEVTLYTDGACSGNPGPGGWGASLLSSGSGRRLEISGAEAQTTNNRMELTGVIEGLRRLKRPSRVRVVTDSRYIVDGMKGWIHTWQKNGWRTADKKPVKNRELWEELIQFTHRHDLRFEWIRGHQGHRENERCDRMAVEAYENLLRLRKGPDRRA
jgi:ribonuclease HI